MSKRRHAGSVKWAAGWQEGNKSILAPHASGAAWCACPLWYKVTCWLCMFMASGPVHNPQSYMQGTARAMPGALVCEPLRAAAGSLPRPRKTTECDDVPTCRGALAKFPGASTIAFPFGMFLQIPPLGGNGSAGNRRVRGCASLPTPQTHTAGSVKLLLPPRQSRVSQRTSISFR